MHIEFNTDNGKTLLYLGYAWGGNNNIGYFHEVLAKLQALGHMTLREEINGFLVYSYEVDSISYKYWFNAGDGTPYIIEKI